MSADTQKFPLQIVLQTVDNATAKLQRFNEKLEARFKPFRSLSKEMGKLSENLGLGKVGQRLGQVAGHVKGLAFGFAAVGTAAAVAGGHIFKGWVERGDQLAETAERLGLNVDMLAGLRFAAKRANVETEAFDGSLDQLNKRLGQLKAGGGPLKAFLEKTPAAFKKQVKGAKSTEEAFLLVADAMKKIQNPQERAALADAFFGKQGKNLINMLAQGSPEIEKLVKRYLQLAGSQERFAKTSSALSDAFDDIGAAMDGVGATIVGVLGPHVTRLAKQFADFLSNNREKIGKWAEDFAKKIPDMLKRVGELFDKFKSVWDTIGGAEGALKIFAAVKLAPLAASVAQLTANLGGLVAKLLAANGAAGGVAAGKLGLAGAVGYGTYYGTSKILQAAGLVSENGDGTFEPASHSGYLRDDGTFEKNTKPSHWGNKSEAHIKLDITGAPKGSRVSTKEDGPMSIDLSVGYANALMSH